MRELTEATLHEAIASGVTLVVESGLHHLSDSPNSLLADQFPGVVFGHVNPAAEPGIVALFGLQSGPALMIFREGIGLYLQPGHHEAERIAGLLRQVCALDMKEVKAKLEQERSEIAVHMHRMCPAARRGPVP